MVEDEVEAVEVDEGCFLVLDAEILVDVPSVVAVSALESLADEDALVVFESVKPKRAPPLTSPSPRALDDDNPLQHYSQVQVPY